MSIELIHAGDGRFARPLFFSELLKRTEETTKKMEAAGRVGCIDG